VPDIASAGLKTRIVYIVPAATVRFSDAYDTGTQVKPSPGTTAAVGTDPLASSVSLGRPPSAATMST
jgi:hypothetical protein